MQLLEELMRLQKGLQPTIKECAVASVRRRGSVTGQTGACLSSTPRT